MERNYREGGGKKKIYRTASRATLIDQDTGNIYQIIETKESKDRESSTVHSVSATVHNGNRESSGAYRENSGSRECSSSQDYSYRECPPPSETPSTTSSYTPISPNPVSYHMSQTLCPTPLTQAGLCGRSLRMSMNDDYAQIVKSRSPRKQASCDYETSLMRREYSEYIEPQQTYDYPPTHRETIERYIAVPISSTDHLLISSTGTGQHYLAEPVSNLLSERLQERTMAAQGYMTYNNRFNLQQQYSQSQTESQTYDKPPLPLPAPCYERPSPLGASSRATSKMSLDCIDQETNF